ncbi:DUF3891 family protein [Brasilonema bromeliae]|uniref:DUF3891 domain-containing protein n=1 Tax=Brasilonema bromeliae SPC951 TaxID=385972 RepID=A0ABX1PC79_9CYAN|nr:DUF3891 family protein [Brasilonema bromeliae]NMG21382.1 DUF3891 domain-containing protein [Brasilonema bromeliae SPC951]
MLHRLTKQGLICITQPNHAWVAGQLAQVWGNERFGEFAPKKEVCLAAQLHDIGWLFWEQAPTLNPQTGYPNNFMELSTPEHINIWSGARQLALPWGRYVALLISLHGTSLYERFTSWQNSPTSSQIVQNFLEREYAFQEQVIAFLKNDEYYAPYTKPEVVERNRKLVAIWDALSIILCQELTNDAYLSGIPTIDGETTVKLTLKDVKDNHYQVAVSPCPFQVSEVELVYEGRLLQETFSDEKAMREALMGDCAVTLSTTLQPE